jgi:predicted anti-sigma-YlaC factor YlaD
MNCRRARLALERRHLDRLAPAEGVELDEHLAGCDSCAATERADRFIAGELASLRGQIPYTIDVHQRVMIEIDRLAPPDRQEVSAWQLGWSTAIVALAAMVLVVLLWGSWPEWSSGVENAIVLVQGLAEVAVTLGTLLLSLLAVPFKMIAGLRDLWLELPAAAARLRPFAITGVALCYLFMAATIVRVVGRDLRRPVARPAYED